MKNKPLNFKTGIILVILITLQFYIVFPLTQLAIGTDIIKHATYMYFYSMSSYTIIVLGIIVLHIKGSVLFKDYFSLLIIVFSCFLRFPFGGSYESIYRQYMMFLGLVLLIYIINNQIKFNIPSLKSVFIGFLWSISTVLMLTIVYATLTPLHGSFPSNILGYIVNTIIFQLSFVVVIEEAVFRGLIFGFLVISGFKENVALFVQAILFWGYHYHYINDPILFFVFVPLYTLSVTFLIKKYKMMYAPIIMHLLVNVFVRVFVAML